MITTALSPAPATAEDLPALMRAYCAGDVGAFLSLYAACAPLVRAQLRERLADGASAERVDELLEATFLELHACRASYVLGADPTGWLLEIARAIACERREPGWLRRGLLRLSSRGALRALRVMS